LSVIRRFLDATEVAHKNLYRFVMIMSARNSKQHAVVCSDEKGDH